MDLHSFIPQRKKYSKPFKIAPPFLISPTARRITNPKQNLRRRERVEEEAVLTMDGGAGGVGMGGGGGGDVELMSKTLQVEHKLFYFDLKENSRGRYLKISEKTSATRSTIIVPSNAIFYFFDIFGYYVDAADQAQDAVSKELQLDNKVFYFDTGDNKRGTFLKISEASLNRNRSTIIVPAGSAQGEGWAAFRDILAKINEVNEVNEGSSQVPYIIPNQKGSESNEQVPGLSDDVGVGFISGHGNQHPSRPEIKVDRVMDLPPREDLGNMGVSKVIRVDQKRFFFDLGNNNRGHYLRISEVAGTDRSSIILPLSGLTQFHEMVSHFVEIMKDRNEEPPSVKAE